MRLVDFSEVPDLELVYPLFFQKKYADYEQTRGWQVILVTDGTSYMPIKLKHTNIIRQGQYLYPPIEKGQRLTSTQEKNFIEAFVVFCQKQSICDFLSPPMHYSVFNSVPAGSFYTDLGIIVVNLTKTEDELFKSFSSNYRNEIRKALAENVRVEFNNNEFDAFYSLYKKTHQRQGVYFDQEQELRNLIECLGEENCKIVLAKKGDVVLGASLVLVNGNEGYYFQSGAMENCPYPGANKLLQLEIMKWLKANGANRYVMGGNRLGDIAGTKYEGIQKFKLRFGAEIEKGTHFYTKVTWRYSLYSKLLKAYLILRNIKQNTKGLNYRYG
jgi:hypothetical protein